MTKKSFVKDIGNIFGDISNDKSEQEKIIKETVQKKPSKKASQKKSGIKPKTLTKKGSQKQQFKEIKLDCISSIDQSQQLKDKILKEYNQSRRIKLTAEKCDAIDLSIIQLLYSLYKTAQKDKKDIEIDIPINEELTILLQNAGIYKKFFTGADSNKLLLKHNC